MTRWSWMELDKVGWNWMDPLMGLVGAVVIIHWTYGLLRETSSILLDSAEDLEKVEELRAAIEEVGDSMVADLHLWRIEADHYALICALVTHDPQEPEHYKKRIREVLGGAHVTVEVNPLFSDNVAMSLEGSWGLVHPLILPHHGVVASNTINYRSLRRVGGQRCFRPQ